MKHREAYRVTIEYLDSLNRSTISVDYMRDQSRPVVFLKRTQALLDRLRNPERDFKYVHITGTSGKGTVSTMVHEGLVADGRICGLFTSPYVTAATEKIRVNDLYIGVEEFVKLVEEVRPHVEYLEKEGEYGRPSYFEVFFVLALLYFRERKCEWVVLEVGAGGRYDATNVVEKPHAVAITNIDYDHVQILGKTLLSIADNKAGIIKKDARFFTTEKRPALLKLFKRECERVGAHFSALPVTPDYMENNRALARAILECVGVSGNAIEKGLETARLPCRFEIVAREPTVVLDGAHNRAKMRATAHNARALPHHALHLVLGINAKKDIEAIVKEIVPLAHYVYLTGFNNSGGQSYEPEELREVVEKYLREGALCEIVPEAHEALAQARRVAERDDLVLATGSFYMVGELREEWYPEEWVLEHRKSFK